METPNKTLILIIVIVLFTVTFISSALITYRIKRKKSVKKPKSDERKDLTE